MHRVPRSRAPLKKYGARAWRSGAICSPSGPVRGRPGPGVGVVGRHVQPGDRAGGRARRTAPGPQPSHLHHPRLAATSRHGTDGGPDPRRRDTRPVRITVQHRNAGVRPQGTHGRRATPARTSDAMMWNAFYLADRRRRVKLGYHTGYWSAGPPAGITDAIARCEALGLRLDLDGRGVRLGLPHAAGLVGRGDEQGPARHEHHAAVGPHAGRDGDGRDDPRPPLRRPVRPRPRRVRPAGRRGLVRPAVPEAAGPHPRVRRHRPQDPGPRRAGDQRRRVLPAALPGRLRPRQAAEVDRAPAASRHPDHAGRRGAEERRAGRRDRRRLAADVLLAQDGRLLPGRAGRGFRPAGRAAHGRDVRGAGVRAGRRRTTTSRPRPTWSARPSRSTSAAWARRR